MKLAREDCLQFLFQFFLSSKRNNIQNTILRQQREDFPMDLLVIQVFSVTNVVVTNVMGQKIPVKLLKNSLVSSCTGRGKDKIR